MMSTETATCKVAISADFLTSFSGIPKQKQSKVVQFVSKFRENPKSSGINYEKVNAAKDQRIRSVRIDDEYRGIVYKPDKGNVYLLLWVDNHDKAYEWARRKKCHVNSETGSLQVYDVDDEPVTSDISDTQDAEDSKNQKAGNNIKSTLLGVFANYNDKDLIRIGVPRESLKYVRCINNIDELDEKQHLLPREAYEALFFLASGYSVEDVTTELFGETQQEKEVDIDDYEAALKRPVTRQLFMVIDGEEGEKELNEMLAAPLEKWRVFLHPLQRRIVEKDYNGPARVLGGAGTGKTVVAMHRAKWLAQNFCNNNDDRILFTTFTRNLAEDITNNLKKICTPELMRKIEVVNIDRWVVNFLNKQDYNYTVVYGASIDNLWEDALILAPDEQGLPASFYKEEWDKVIKPNEIHSLKDYLKVMRRGRGTRLDRKARKAIWPVFEELRNLMNEKELRDIETAMMEARIILENNNKLLNYKSIVVDEAQDLSVQAFRLIRQMAGDERVNDIFIVGDAHQRIYRNKASMSHCGINILGRSSRLKINYRTTEETRAWAYQLLHGLSIDDLNDGLDDSKGYRSLMHGPPPLVKCFDSAESEVDYIVSHIRELEKQGVDQKDICLVARKTKILNMVKENLSQHDIRIYKIKREGAEERELPGLRIATMHRVKGLEFDYIIITGANQGIIPHERLLEEAADEIARKEILLSERSLLYVAATRAKKTVLITCHGKPSDFLKDRV